MTEDDIKYLLDWAQTFHRIAQNGTKVTITTELAAEAADHFERIAHNLLTLTTLST